MQKLKLIKCNKSLQKNINISIINYEDLAFSFDYSIKDNEKYQKKMGGEDNYLENIIVFVHPKIAELSGMMHEFILDIKK